MAPNQSQANTLVARGGRSTAGAPPGATGSVLRRRPVRGSGGSGSSKAQQNAMNFYTDDTPGWKMSPVVVIGMSLGFIAFVTILHVVGKFQRA
ncbi:Protein transport protein Sec61 subunit beta [Tetrabaena socialis]|uniref:Protein transport protein Sec61 subunit beta n=1 Tax=Tetrabaena socialis TaxID=47790 RepID=A0A2J7ZXZ2_9CHLO|nr:Protein transport protein Sec61 subunit beta [Tetrabaena socialis]|eukprot:PNH05139.1 Protein transport protein Sec61 subunit beta [Tetrabaena socialis]